MGLSLPTTAADRQRELLIAESFDRADTMTWGTTDSGQRWHFPPGSAGVSLASSGGVMTLPAPRSGGSAMLQGKSTNVRDVAVAFSFALDRMPGHGGAVIEAVARKSASGSYRAQIRVAPRGGVWLSFSKERYGSPAGAVGRKALLPRWRYAAGQGVNIRFEVIGQDATQLRLKVWPAGTAEPRRWLLVGDDPRDDVGAPGRVGIAASLTKRASNVPLQVRFDDLRVSRARNTIKAPVTRTKPRAQDSTPQTEAQDPGVPAPTPTPTPAPTPTPTPAPTPTPTPAPTPLGNVFNVPTSIDRSGATNVTTAIRNFIASVPDGNTIVFPANATYNMASGGIRLGGRHRLKFVGNGTTIKTSGCSYGDSPFLIEEGSGSRSSDISIDGFVLVGGNTLAGTDRAYDTCGDDASGVTIFASSNISLTNLRFRNIYADCLYVSEGGSGRAKGVTLSDSVCELNGRMGVAVVGGEDVRVQRVQFDKISLHPFDIEPNGAAGGAIGVVIADNTIGSFGVDPLLAKRLFSLNGYDDGSAPVRGIVFARNTVTGGPLIIASDDPGRSDIDIVDNTSTVRAAGPVMTFRSCADLTITGNRQPLSSGQLASVSCTNVVYQDNATS